MVFQGGYRCNNVIEAWHKSFNNSVKQEKEISKVIKCILAEQKHTEAEIVKIMRGDERDRREIVIQKDKALVNEIKTYKRERVFDFLKKISVIVHSGKDKEKKTPNNQ